MTIDAMPDVPEISIIVTVDRQRVRGNRCVASLVRQRGIERAEILLQDAGHMEHAPLPAAAHPRVRTLPLPRGLAYGDALWHGVRAARGDVVAFIEEHVVALPGWIEAIVAAHRARPAVGVGSELHFDNPGRGDSDFIDLLAVGPWMAPAIEGETPTLRWQNTSYKRAALLVYGDRLPRLLDAEDVLFAQLRADGQQLWTEPAAKLRHASEREFRLFLRGAFVSNRLGAARRAELLGMTSTRRLRAAAGAILNIARAPGYILANLQRSPLMADKYRLARRRRPWLAVYALVFSSGACVGYLCGAGAAGVRFLEYELNADRDITGYEAPPDA